MAENYRFFGAPHVAVISSDDGLSTYGAIDCGGYVANFLNAATVLGVATIPQAALAVRSDLVRGYFGLPARRVRDLVRLCRPKPSRQRLPDGTRIAVAGRSVP